VTGYGTAVQGSILSRRNRLSVSSMHPDSLWGPPIFLYNGHRGPVHKWKIGCCMKLTTHLYLAPSFRMHKAIPPFPQILSWNDAKLNTVTTFPLPYYNN
jgi:hypothetical protein